MLDSVEWGEYKLGDLFDSTNGDTDIQKKHLSSTGDWVVTAGVQNLGILGKTNVQALLSPEGTITIDMFGNAFFRMFPYKMVTHARVFSLKPKYKLTSCQGFFMSNSLRYLSKLFGYDNMCSWSKIKDLSISLPQREGAIDFTFMERFIAELNAAHLAELNAYLTITGLKDYNLTKEEEDVLRDFSDGRVQWKEYRFDKVFDKIQQGRRLKKEDQLPGNIPFVMAGVTNSGVVSYISNPVNQFPKNAITIDIFGNTFYRNYSFGAGDDTGVYWSEKQCYSIEEMLFYTVAMRKVVMDRYSYGNKLRSSQSCGFMMQLPTDDRGEANLPLMKTFISAIQKLVIRDVVDYAERERLATEAVIGR